MDIKNIEAQNMISKAEAQARELTLNAIRMIKRVEKNFTVGTINKWSKEGHLGTHESHIETFRKYIEE